MEVLSYLLGKKAGGGGGSINDCFITSDIGNTGADNVVGLIKKLPSFDLNELVYAFELFANCINAEEIGNITNTSYLESAEGMFKGCAKLQEIPLFNTSNVWYMGEMFFGCDTITNIPNFDTSTCVDMHSMFQACGSLVSIPQLSTSLVENMNGMFANCKSLTTIPLLNTSNVSDMGNFIKGSTGHKVKNLTDTSLDNILQMCINATNYSETKTLKALGFENGQYSSARIQALPHYADFISAGWTIGY
jgi:surface protein